VFTDVRERVAIGIWSGVAGMAIARPRDRRFLLEHFWWGSVFIVNVPIVAALVADISSFPRAAVAADRLGGAVLSIVGCSPSCGRSSRRRPTAGRAARSSVR
jgi:hypothetical protein